MTASGCWDQINTIKYIQGPRVDVNLATDVVTASGEKSLLPNTTYRFLTYDNPLPRPNDPLPTFKYRGTFATDASGRGRFTTLHGYVWVTGNHQHPKGTVTISKVFEVDASRSHFVIRGKLSTPSAEAFPLQSVLPSDRLYTDCFPKVCNPTPNP